MIAGLSTAIGINQQSTMSNQQSARTISTQQQQSAVNTHHNNQQATISTQHNNQQSTINNQQSAIVCPRQNRNRTASSPWREGALMYDAIWLTWPNVADSGLLTGGPK